MRLVYVERARNPGSYQNSYEETLEKLKDATPSEFTKCWISLNNFNYEVFQAIDRAFEIKRSVRNTIRASFIWDGPDKIYIMVKLAVGEIADIELSSAQYLKLLDLNNQFNIADRSYVPDFGSSKIDPYAEAVRNLFAKMIGMQYSCD